MLKKENGNPTYLDSSTVQVLIQFNCYVTSLDKFVTTKLDFKFNDVGSIVPENLKVITFAMD
jgi:hypothetical protein